MLPIKLLECAEVDAPWPRRWRYAGVASELDYATEIHGEPARYVHEFTTGVKVYLANESGEVELPPSVKPILFGAMESLYVTAEDGDGLVFAHDTFAPSRFGEDAGYMAVRAPYVNLAWDPEQQRLLMLAEDGAVAGVLCGSMLELREDAMILG